MISDSRPISRFVDRKMQRKRYLGSAPVLCSCAHTQTTCFCWFVGLINQRGGGKCGTGSKNRSVLNGTRGEESVAYLTIQYISIIPLFFDSKIHVQRLLFVNRSISSFKWLALWPPPAGREGRPPGYPQLKRPYPHTPTQPCRSSPMPHNQAHPRTRTQALRTRGRHTAGPIELRASLTVDVKSNQPPP